MKVLVIGSGGREHALCLALARSDAVTEVVVTPGNPGMRSTARVVPGGSDNASLLAVARAERPDLVVVGPEDPLVAGVADELRDESFAVFGPDRAAARLEGSKRYAKEFMTRNGVPTAAFQTFSDLADATAYLSSVGAPIVVKDDRLAAGKGVTVCDTLDQALRAAQDVIESGGQVVLEERLIGPELSVFVLLDGHSHATLPVCRDHKRVGDGDVGPMTGGMGAVAPIELSPTALAELEETVVLPVMRGIQREGIDYRGVLFIGAMHTRTGFKVIEFNVRFGDPEAQVLMALLRMDAYQLLEAVANRRLSEIELAWRDGAAACIALAAPGYPGPPARGIELNVPADLPAGVHVLYAGVAGAGTDRDPFVSAGGRVLNVVAVGQDLRQALERAYSVVDAIDFPGAVLRRDIGRDESDSRQPRPARER